MSKTNTLILLDKEQAAEYISCHPYHLYRMVRDGRLPRGVRYPGDRKRYWSQQLLDVYKERFDREAFRVHDAYVKGK